MSMPDYEAGRHAYLQGVPFDPTRSQEFRNGWEDEQDDATETFYYGRFENEYEPLNFERQAA